jgi:VWFA-related protein
MKTKMRAVKSNAAKIHPARHPPAAEINKEGLIHGRITQSGANPMKHVRDIMTENPACCTSDASVQEAAEMMVKHDCGEIPVVKSKDNPKLRGVICFLGVFAASLSTFNAQQSSPRVTGQESAAGAEVRINQIDTFEFPKVTIFATVLKDGAPVPGLTDRDFRVREDEVDQEPLTVVPKLTPLSVVLTMDTSGSMKKRLADAQAAAKSFIATLDPQDKFQVIRFSRDVKTIYPLGVDRTAANSAIDGTTPRGDTALWDALYTSVDSLRTVAGRKAIVLLSDGVDDDGSGKPLSKNTVTDVLTLARQVNVPIYAIGIGTELDEVNLRKVAADSGALYLSATDPAELKRLYDSIGKQLAGQYNIFYSSNLPADGSEHRVQLKFADKTGTKSYQAPMKAAQTAAVAPTRAVEKPTEPPAELPDWLPPYPGTKPEGVSIKTDPQTGKRTGSFFFRTNDEQSKVMDFYEDKMTRATWDVSRAPTQVWGSSASEGRKFEIKPERRGDQVRATVTFEEKKASAPAASAAAAPAAPNPPDWLPVYPGSAPEGLSVATDPRTGKHTGSYFFRTTDDQTKVMDFFEDKMTKATWHVSRAPTQVWGSSASEGRKFEVKPTHRGDETRVRVEFEDK